MTIKKPFVFMAAALAKNGGIGYKNALPWCIPEDSLFFDHVTSKSYGTEQKKFNDKTEWCNTVIMGRRSFEASPMLSVPLFNRYNVIVTKNSSYSIDKYPLIAEVTNSLESAFLIANQKVKEDGRIFLLGGEQIYREGIMLPECTHVLITKIYSSKHVECDTFIPEIDESVFHLASHDELEDFLKEKVPKGRRTYEHFEYEFLLYVRQ